MDSTVPTTEDQSISNRSTKQNLWRRFWSFFSVRLGFQRLFSFTCFVILGGILAGFSLAHFRSLVPHRYYNGAFAPGETYWVRSGARKVGMIMHLGAILPCGILAVLQFVPIIRKNYLLFHRINGYIVLTLLAVGVAGALILSRHSFGGDVSSGGGIYGLAFIVIGSALMGYYNIKHLQIEEHRKWMLRAIVYMSSIITQRIIMIISAIIVSSVGGFATAWYCDEIAYTLDYNDTKIAIHGSRECVGGSAPTRQVLIPAHMDQEEPIQMASALRSAFGNSIWIAMLIHIFVLEVYFHLTPKETARLRSISYQKQLEAGFEHPGSAGITSDRWGDADPYQPK
ncbi:hypothetical protein FS842_009160 [Serendipita sp. 407]|nr:hypothetical protein FS842_009160 [Serendipita sp. 407]